ncbi:MAG: hypothetical protein JNL70_15710 [Saprospiraceae bacterium]|nr:hypothetical protein [Saprospiraceae bacterium]
MPRFQCAFVFIFYQCFAPAAQLTLIRLLEFFQSLLRGLYPMDFNLIFYAFVFIFYQSFAPTAH